MGAVSAFTIGNYHCKPLMTDVIVIYLIDVTAIHQVNESIQKKQKGIFINQNTEDT